jgi:predicted nucleotidyltransferase
MTKQESIAVLGNQCGTTRMRGFGSMVRSEECADSDVVFLVEFPRELYIVRHRIMGFSTSISLT